MIGGQTKYRLAAAPAYLAGVSVLSTVALAFIRSFDSWVGTLTKAWLSQGAILFTLGMLATAWAAATLSREGRLGRAIAVSAGGTVATLFATALLINSILYPNPSFFEAMSMGVLDWLYLVLTLGAPGVLAGIAAPVLWGRWETRREQAGSPG